MIYWLNGAFHDEPMAIRIDDRGLLLGDGVFETLLVRDGIPAFWDAHLTRLTASLDELIMGRDVIMPLVREGRALIRRLAQENQLDKGDASLRVTITRGPAPRGLRVELAKAPTVMMTIAPAPAQKAMAAGRTLHVSRYKRAEVSIASRIKTTSYIDNILALHEAIEAGCDDALLLNSVGRVACVSAGNVFVLSDDDGVTTPPCSEGALPGIVRDVLMMACQRNGITLNEAPIELEVARRSELVVTNSMIGLVPAGIDSVKGMRGDLFDRLNAWYQSALSDDLNQSASKV